MNDKSQNNLISAYHDGELSAAERADVERLLASSPEARAELESYRKLSSLLREAGRPTLQSDLTPLVMQTIEQRMLLPQTAPRPLTNTRKAKSWTKWAATAAALAACVIVAVTLAPRANREVGVARNKPEQQVTPPVQPQPAPKVIQTPDVKAVAKVESVKPENAVAPPLTPADLNLPIDVIENLKKANFGQIVGYVKKSGKDVTVFHLMVLDVQPGLESLQMILSAQQISGPKSQPKQSGVVAVYVQANQDQLDKVIAELMSQDQQQFVALAVNQPVKAEDVQKLVAVNSENMASGQVPVKRNDLTKLGVNEVQILAGKEPRKGNLPGTSFAQKKPGFAPKSALRKLLIVVEKVPESLRPTSADPQN